MVKILCVHQGGELYGSDRSFALSVAAIRQRFPSAFIHVELATGGPLVGRLKPNCDRITYFCHGVLRKADVQGSFVSFVRGQYIGFLHALRAIRGYDMVYINTVVMSGYILASRFAKGVAVVHVREWAYGWSGMMLSLMLKFSGAKMIFNSCATKNSYAFEMNGGVIYNGTDSFHYLPRKFDSNPLKILVIGRINSWKGQELLIDALAKLSFQETKGYMGRIVGSAFAGQEWRQAALRERADINDVSEIVDFF
jgi:glycosyltransferase involved in cell wall biosynthesis